MIIQTNTELDSYLEQYSSLNEVITVCNTPNSGYATMDADFQPNYHPVCDDVIIRYYE